MIRTNVENVHWPYYIAFEYDLEKLSRYIEFDKSNFKVYSIELARLLLSAASETDVLLKEICRIIKPKCKPNNINKYREILHAEECYIHETKVVSRRFRLDLEPWSNWAGNENPVWWQSYNAVKHDRANSFKQGCLKNVLNVVAALLVLNTKYAFLKLEKENPEFPYDMADAIRGLYPQSELFRIAEPMMYSFE